MGARMPALPDCAPAGPGASEPATYCMQRLPAAPLLHLRHFRPLPRPQARSSPRQSAPVMESRSAQRSRRWSRCAWQRGAWHEPGRMCRMPCASMAAAKLPRLLLPDLSKVALPPPPSALQVLMWVCAPITWPLGRLLDLILGHEDTLMKRQQIKAIVSLHAEGAGAPGDRARRALRMQRRATRAGEQGQGMPCWHQAVAGHYCLANKAALPPHA
jgi:hypothetical protein